MRKRRARIDFYMQCEVVKIARRNPSLTMNEIARLAGITPRTLHNHSELKRMIMRERIGDRAQRLENIAKTMDYDDFS